ncbi:MAG: DoxX family protein [Xanthobacteraceae bacterium]|nr:DoxX family protein [Xanthobacteraceae bacterium]
MLEHPTSLVVPALGPVYAALAPVVEAMLRVVVGLTLVPHGLRIAFGCFAGSGLGVTSLEGLAAELDRGGYRPGRLWAPAIALTELVCGPLLALGLFTRVAAVPIVIFLGISNVERWRVGGFFWNTQGLEYTLMWTIAALYFLVHGGGVYSLDHLLVRCEF